MAEISLTPFPPTGIDGTYSGSCVSCMRGTDTAISFAGSAEWIMAGLTVLGVPEKEAIDMTVNMFGCSPGMVPVGDNLSAIVRVCRPCARKARGDFPKPVVYCEGAEIPIVSPLRRC